MLDQRARFFAIPLFTIFVCGCAARQSATGTASSGAASSGAAAGQPFDPKAAYGRELSPLAKRPFDLDKLSFETEVQGDPKIVEKEGFYQLTIPLGTESPLECFVYKKELDPGGALLVVNREAAKAVEIRLFRVADVSLVGEHPIVSLEAQYVTKTDKGQAVGELKSMYYPHPVTPTLCMHDELGYNDTFRRITKSLVASMKMSDLKPAESKLVEVFVDKIGDRPIGFSSHVLLSDKEGKLTYRSRSSSFISKSEAELLIQDAASTEIWDADGKLLEGAYAQSEAGELKLNVTLKKIGPQEYAFNGNDGKAPVSGNFKTKTKRGLVTDKVAASLVASELLTGKSRELKLEQYQAGTRASAPVEVSYKSDAKAKGRIKMTLNRTDAMATVDPQGRIEKLEIPIGSFSMLEERVLVRGAH